MKVNKATIHDSQGNPIRKGSRIWLNITTSKGATVRCDCTVIKKYAPQELLVSFLTPIGHACRWFDRDEQSHHYIVGFKEIVEPVSTN